MSVLRCNLTYTVKVLFDILSPLIKTHFLDDFSFLGMFLLEKCVKGGGAYVDYDTKIHNFS